MFSMKKKKELIRVEVLLRDERKDEMKKVEYNIPTGGSMKVGSFGGDLLIYDADSTLVKRVNWQAGYTQEYTFIYKED